MSKEVKSIALPAKTRAILERALQEQQAMQAMIQQQQRHINDLVEAAREMLDVPEGWRIENTAVGFVPPEESA
jgi:anti-sigma-K factor RskA